MISIYNTWQVKKILVSEKLDAQFLLQYVYLNPLHVSSNSVLIHRRTIVLIHFWYNYSVLVAVWLDLPELYKDARPEKYKIEGKKSCLQLFHHCMFLY